MKQVANFLIASKQFNETYRVTRKSDETLESDAEHSWSVAFTCLVLMPELKREFPELDGAKVYEMAILHDLAEIKTGDTATWDAAARVGKDEREREAMEEITKDIPEEIREKIMTVWNEVEVRESAEAKFVKSVDRIDPPIQKIFAQNGWGVSDPEHATIGALDSRQRPRHEFSKTMTALYDIVRERVITTFKLTEEHDNHLFKDHQ